MKVFRCPQCRSRNTLKESTGGVEFCTVCGFQLNESDKVFAFIEEPDLPKQKERLSPDEARERWRLAVAQQLENPDWPFEPGMETKIAPIIHRESRHVGHGVKVRLVKRTFIPKGVGKYDWIEPGLEGTTVGHGFGIYIFVRWSDGREGTVDFEDLEMLE